MTGIGMLIPQRCRSCGGTGFLGSAGGCRIICETCAVDRWSTGTEWTERCYLTDMEE
jgi:hypothetical protein